MSHPCFSATEWTYGRITQSRFIFLYWASRIRSNRLISYVWYVINQILFAAWKWSDDCVTRQDNIFFTIPKRNSFTLQSFENDKGHLFLAGCWVTDEFMVRAGSTVLSLKIKLAYGPSIFRRINLIRSTNTERNSWLDKV